jgi:hypothetical protein
LAACSSVSEPFGIVVTVPIAKYYVIQIDLWIQSSVYSQEQDIVIEAQNKPIIPFNNVSRMMEGFQKGSRLDKLRSMFLVFFDKAFNCRYPNST